MTLEQYKKIVEEMENQHLYNILLNGFNITYTNMIDNDDKKFEQERGAILRIKVDAFDAISRIINNPHMINTVYRQTCLIINLAEEKFKQIYALTGSRIVKEMTGETTTLNNPLPELTYEEEERDFFKQEDTIDLELYKIKQKMIDIEKLVRAIYRDIVIKPPSY